MTASSGKKIVGKFKVVRGSHNEGGTTYRTGEVVESVSNLLKHNSPGAVKFVSVDDVQMNQVADEPEDDGFNDLSVAELRQIAEEGSIDLSGCGNSKDKIIDRLRLAEKE